MVSDIMLKAQYLSHDTSFALLDSREIDYTPALFLFNIPYTLAKTQDVLKIVK